MAAAGKSLAALMEAALSTSTPVGGPMASSGAGREISLGHKAPNTLNTFSDESGAALLQRVMAIFADDAAHDAEPKAVSKHHVPVELPNAQQWSPQPSKQTGPPDQSNLREVSAKDSGLADLVDSHSLGGRPASPVACEPVDTLPTMRAVGAELFDAAAQAAEQPIDLPYLQRIAQAQSAEQQETLEPIAFGSHEALEPEEAAAPPTDLPYLQVIAAEAPVDLPALPSLLPEAGSPYTCIPPYMTDVLSHRTANGKADLSPIAEDGPFEDTAASLRPASVEISQGAGRGFEAASLRPVQAVSNEWQVWALHVSELLSNFSDELVNVGSRLESINRRLDKPRPASAGLLPSSSELPETLNVETDTCQQQFNRLASRVELIERLLQNQLPKIQPYVGMQVRVTTDEIIYERECRIAGLSWPNADDDGRLRTRKIGLEGRIEEIDLTDKTVHLSDDVRWVPLRALVGCETYQDTLFLQAGLDMYFSELLPAKDAPAVLLGRLDTDCPESPDIETADASKAAEESLAEGESNATLSPEKAGNVLDLERRLIEERAEERAALAASQSSAGSSNLARLIAELSAEQGRQQEQHQDLFTLALQHQKQLQEQQQQIWIEVGHSKIETSSSGQLSTPSLSEGERIAELQVRPAQEGFDLEKSSCERLQTPTSSDTTRDGEALTSVDEGKQPPAMAVTYIDQLRRQMELNRQPTPPPILSATPLLTGIRSTML